MKMLVGLSGPTINLLPGEEGDFADDEAKRLVAAGFAIPVVADKTERTVNRPVREKRKG